MMSVMARAGGWTAIALWLAAAGCGRVDFHPLSSDAEPPGTIDMAPDLSLGHDEDADGLADADDPCPHVAGDAADADGDTVGDACDPNPLVAGEAWVRFATMQEGDVPFVLGTLTQEADAVRYTSATAGGKRIQFPMVSLRVDVGFEILDVLGTAQHSIASGVSDNDTEPYYFVELTDNNMNQSAAIVVKDGPYTGLHRVPHGGVHPGVGHLRYDAMVAPTPRFTAEAGWIGELYELAADTAEYDGGTSVKIDFAGIDVRLRYIALIAMP